MTELQTVADEFKGDMTRVKRLLDLMRDFRSFAAADVPETDSPDPWRSASTLHETSRGVRTDLPVLSGSMLLYVVGRFEYFVQSLVQVLATEICEQADGFESLPKSLTSSLRTKTLEQVQTPPRYGIDEITATAYLDQLVRATRTRTGPIQITARIVSTTDANMRPDVLAEVLKRVGIENFWKEFGKQYSVRAYFGEDEGKSTALARTRLDSLMKARNQIAHPTGDLPFPDVDAVHSDINFLELVASVCEGTASTHLAVLARAK